MALPLGLVLCVAACGMAPPAPARVDHAADVRDDRPRYLAALARARAFLDALDVDPKSLRAAGLKGKKKLAEALDAYGRLLEVAPPDARAAIHARVAALAQPTLEVGYHDMLTIDDRAFHEDATSYLRIAVLLERLGVDVRLYREKIRAMKGRLDVHMRERGPHQRLAFHGYYQRFGLEEPFPLGAALADGVIAQRPEPDRLTRAETYELTHEIYVAYDFGERLDAEPFGGAARTWLARALPALLARERELEDADLAAELLACMRYARVTDDPEYARGLAFLLGAQNTDGSWGDYKAARARLGERVKEGLYLHTTMVAIEALVLALSLPGNRARSEPRRARLAE